MAEGSGIAPGTEGRDNFENRNRPRISQISLFNGIFAQFGENKTYGELFIHCLSQHNMLCYGVYRFRDSNQDGNYPKIVTPSSKRYVICNPPANFKLLQTDIVYVLEQYNPDFKQLATPQRSPKIFNRNVNVTTTSEQKPTTSSASGSISTAIRSASRASRKRSRSREEFLKNEKRSNNTLNSSSNMSEQSKPPKSAFKTQNVVKDLKNGSSNQTLSSSSKRSTSRKLDSSGDNRHKVDNPNLLASTNGTIDYFDTIYKLANSKDKKITESTF